MMLSNESNEVPCIYDFIPPKFLKKYDNPNFNAHHISVPFRMLVVGSSGAGKTQVVCHILEKMKNTFGNIKIFTRNKSEPIYEWLEDKIPSTHLQICENLNDLPSLSKSKDGTIKGFDSDLQHLVIFDDLCLEKDQSGIAEYFIRSRKIAKGISLMYLTQSYYKVPKTIRINLNYCVIKKLACMRDLNMIMSEYNLGIEKDRMLKIYKYCTLKKTDFLFLDLDAPPEKRFRHNLLEVIDIDDIGNTEEPKEPKEPKKEQKEQKEIEGNGLLNGLMNKGLSLKAQRYLKLFGDVPIISLSCVRNKVNGIITKTLNTLSGQNFDTLFHLGMWIQLDNKKKFIVEKNATVNIDVKTRLNTDQEQQQVNIEPGLTLNKMFENALNEIGANKLLSYSAYDKNCQQFVIDMLNSSKILSNSVYEFVKQDTDSLFENKPIIRKITNSITDLGAVADNFIDKTTTPLYMNGGSVVVKKVCYSDVDML